MGLKNGSLLWRRMQIPLVEGTSDIDTGLTQPHRSFADYSLNEPSLGTTGTAPPPPATLPASRIMVVPLAPFGPWNSITHGEPYFNTTTGTVHVELNNTGSPALVNVLFWDPHSMIGPGQADVYGPSGPPQPPSADSVQQIPVQVSGFPWVLPGDLMGVFGSGYNSLTSFKINGIETPRVVVDDFTITAGPLPTPPDPNPTSITVTAPPWPPVTDNPTFGYSRWRTLAEVEGDPNKQNDPRMFGYTLLLDNGLILEFGGTSGGSGPDDTVCWLYNPANNQWATTGSMSISRRFFAAVKLQDGRVLACGGTDPGGAALNTAEIYDPGTGLWTNVGNMSVARTLLTANLLNNGTVLVTGGVDGAGVEQASSEIFTVGPNTFGSLAATPAALAGHSAVKIQGGDVITISAQFTSASFGNVYRYNAGGNTWSTVAPMGTPRIGNALRALLLPSGKIITVGGETLPGQQTNVVELYDPVGNSWANAAPITDDPIATHNGATSVQLVLRSDGRAQRSGGLTPAGPIIYTTTSEIYDEGSDTWVPPPGCIMTPTSQEGGFRHSSNTPRGIWDPLIVPILPNDTFYVIDGDGGGGSPSSNTEQYRDTPPINF